MQSTDLRQIKAAIWDQAFIGSARVSCPIWPVVAVRREGRASSWRWFAAGGAGGKLAEGSDANAGLRTLCPNFQPKNVTKAPFGSP